MKTFWYFTWLWGGGRCFYFWLYKCYLHLCHKMKSVFQLSLLRVSDLSGDLCWTPIFHMGRFTSRKGSEYRADELVKRGSSFLIALWFCKNSTLHEDQESYTAPLDYCCSFIQPRRGFDTTLTLQENKPRKFQLLQPVYQQAFLPPTVVFSSIY